MIQNGYSHCLLAIFFAALLASCDSSDRKNAVDPEDQGPLPALEEVVEVENGSLRGVVASDPDEDPATADGVVHFQGIPYAAPPVGVNRWRAPMAVADWEGVREAAMPGPACLQGDTRSTIAQSEDCLFLNIAAPQAETDQRRPVMVWFHGGGGDNGSGHEAIYDIVSLAQQTDTLVVSVNSRLGFLGFLAHPALRAESANASTGNYHHLDQVAALQWLQENIEAFNGDPGNITLFGESAGGIDGCQHLASRLSDGLFHRVIMQSSTCASYNMQALDEGFEQGAFFTDIWGCADASTTLDCLRQQDASALRAALHDAGKADDLLQGDLLAQEVFRPVSTVDGWVFTGALFDMMAESSSAIEVIIGITRNEFTLFTTAEGSINPENNLQSYQQVLRDGQDRLTEEAIQTLTTRLYPCGHYPSCSDALADVMGDAIFACASITAADALVRSGHSVRFYEFNQPANTSLLLSYTIPVKDENAPAIGIPHSADLFYLWDLAIMQSGESPEEAALA
ncbi:MAG: carboxylesterase family protein, partial [Halioglobus sp.]